MIVRRENGVVGGVNKGMCLEFWWGIGGKWIYIFFIG